MSLRIWRDKLLALGIVCIGTALSLYWFPTYGTQLVLLFSAFLVGEYIFSLLKSGNGNFKNPFGRSFLSAGHSYLLFYFAIVVSALGGSYVSSLVLQALTPTFTSLNSDLVIGFVFSIIIFVDLEVRYL